MSLSVERELGEKGYKLHGSCPKTSDEAKQIATGLKARGNYARVVRYSTSVRGYYSYSVWYKSKSK